MLETPPVRPPDETPGADSPSPRRRHQPAWVILGLGVLLAVIVLGAVLTGSRSSTPRSTLSVNPNLDPGTSLNRPAPDFTLTDQFGRHISLRSFRGKVVILAFNDSECTTVCPLTTTAMVDAQRSLGKAGSQVQLLGVDANPKAIATDDVLRYSQLHGMLRAWDFLTGPLPSLKKVWKQYGIAVEIQHGQIDHTPALFVIDPQGRLRRVFLTQTSYATVPQLGQLLAHTASRLLPSHPPVSTHYSYGQIKNIAPSQASSLPRAGGGTVSLGPGAAHLYLFFDTWDREVTDLGRELELLNGYTASTRPGLPRLMAIDEASVEPSSSALPSFLHGLKASLSYPVGIDTTGRVADGYEVQDEPWLVLVTASGRIAWYHDVSTSGWPSVAVLARDVRAALARVPASPSGQAGTRQALAGSPAPLAALHRQGSQLVGSTPALITRIHSLRGYPVVVNVWASWCGPCRAEFGLLARASVQYGRRVAFLGADYNDPSSGDARAFLRQHPVSYPSYPVPQGAIQSLLPGGVQGTPTTFFISPAGKVVYVHTGQYLSQGTLDQDIQAHALGG